MQTTHVNIIDMIHNPQSQTPIEKFADEEGLAKYTKKTGRYFPLADMDRHERRSYGNDLGLLGLLLRRFKDLVLSGPSKSKSRSRSKVPGAAPLSKSARRRRRKRAIAAAKKAAKAEPVVGADVAVAELSTQLASLSV